MIVELRLETIHTIYKLGEIKTTSEWKAFKINEDFTKIAKELIELHEFINLYFNKDIRVKYNTFSQEIGICCTYLY